MAPYSVDWFWWLLIALLTVQVYAQLAKIRETPNDQPWLCIGTALIPALFIWGIAHYGLGY